MKIISYYPYEEDTPQSNTVKEIGDPSTSENLYAENNISIEENPTQTATPIAYSYEDIKPELDISSLVQQPIVQSFDDEHSKYKTEKYIEPSIVPQIEIIPAETSQQTQDDAIISQVIQSKGIDDYKTSDTFINVLSILVSSAVIVFSVIVIFVCASNYYVPIISAALKKDFS